MNTRRNGSTVYVRANGTCNIYDIRYLITRTHRGAITG